jgi:alkanesulfonate monooxygenase SsuD/methylene tetrahydromethanopterin reductase-like flavin-dependent oxidoreductase (luciferase family)
VFLTAIAARTERIRVGHGVVLLPTPFNHPARVAERAAALDIVSNGRLEFGTGRSITEAELGGYDVDPEDSRPMWEEVVRLIPKMWTQEVFEGHSGRYVKMPPRPVIPKPVQKPHPPMWMACTQPSSFEVAALHGLGALCFGFGPMGDVENNLATYREAAARCTDPAGQAVNHRFAPTAVMYCGESNDEALENGGAAAAYFGSLALSLFVPWVGRTVKGYEYYTSREAVERMVGSASQLPSPEQMQREGYTLTGDAEVCLRTLRRYHDLGADLVLCLVQAGHLTHDQISGSLERFGTTVLPEVRSWTRETAAAR